MKSIRLFLLPVILLLVSCSGTERYTGGNGVSYFSSSNNVRLLIDESINEKELRLEADYSLFKEDKKLKQISSGEVLVFSASNNGVTLKLQNDFFEGEYFQLIPPDSNSILNLGGISLRGRLKIMNGSNSIKFINTIDIESYLKGVIPREMPLGKGMENYDALRAFAICARTYTMQQMGSKKYFDLYIDTRDQVYGGVNVEKTISNSAVDDTRNLVLTYNGEPAKVFYSSTCAGKTEDVKNIFGIYDAPYLTTIDDGNEPYCTISHAFSWKEIYTPEVFIERIKNYVNRDSNEWLDYQDYDLENVKVISRYESGRVNELNVEFISNQTGEQKSIILRGNYIRWIIRTADNKNILRSIWFDVNLDENKNITITGKGYGHGVGLCQYGAIGQSRAGKNYKEILYHYFPGTKISYLNDKD